MSALDFYRQQYPDVFGEMNDYQALQELSRGSGKSVDEVAAKLGIDSPSLGVEVAKGVGRGIDQLQGTAYAGVGWLGDVTGLDSVRDWGLAGMKRNAEEAARQGAAVDDYRKVNGLRDALMYGAGAVGEALPQFAPGLGAGGIGARMAVSAAAKKATAEGLELAAKKKLIGDAMQRGAMQGGAAYGIASETANNYGDIYEKTGEHAPGTALAYGVPGGLVEGLSERLLFKNVAKGMPKAMSRSRYVAQEAGKQFLTEGMLEELPQTLLSQAAVNAVDPTVGYDEHELINAALKGGIGGGVIGAGGAMVTGRQKDGTERDLVGKGIDLFYKGVEALSRKRARDKIAAAEAGAQNPALEADKALRSRFEDLFTERTRHELAAAPDAEMPDEEVSTRYRGLADQEADRILTAQARSLGGNEKELRDAAARYKASGDWKAFRDTLTELDRKQSRSSMMEEFDNGAKFSDMTPTKRFEIPKSDEELVAPPINLQNEQRRSMAYRLVGLDDNTLRQKLDGLGLSFEQAKRMRDEAAEYKRRVELARTETAKSQRHSDVSEELSNLAAAWQANEGKKHSWVFDESDDGKALSAKLFGWIKSGFGKTVNDGEVFMPTRMLDELGETAPKVVQSAISAARKEGWDIEDAGDIVEQVKSYAMRNSGDVSVLKNTLRYSQEANWNDKMLQRFAKEMRSKKGQMDKEDYKWLRSQFSDPEKVVEHFRSDSSYYKAPAQMLLRGGSPKTQGEMDVDGESLELSVDQDGELVSESSSASAGITDNDGDWNSGVSEIGAKTTRTYPTFETGEFFNLNDESQRQEFEKLSTEHAGRQNGSSVKRVAKVGIVDRTLEKLAEERGTTVEALAPQTRAKVMRDLVHEYFPKFERLGPKPKGVSELTLRDYERRKIEYEKGLQRRANLLNQKLVALAVEESDFEKLGTQISADDVHMKSADIRKPVYGPHKGTLIFQSLNRTGARKGEASTRPFVTSTQMLLAKMFQAKDSNGASTKEYEGTAQEMLQLLSDGVSSVLQDPRFGNAEKPAKIGTVVNGQRVWFDTADVRKWPQDLVIFRDKAGRHYTLGEALEQIAEQARKSVKEMTAELRTINWGAKRQLYATLAEQNGLSRKDAYKGASAQVAAERAKIEQAIDLGTEEAVRKIYTEYSGDMPRIPRFTLDFDPDTLEFGNRMKEEEKKPWVKADDLKALLQFGTDKALRGRIVRALKEASQKRFDDVKALWEELVSNGTLRSAGIVTDVTLSRGNQVDEGLVGPDDLSAYDPSYIKRDERGDMLTGSVEMDAQSRIGTSKPVTTRDSTVDVRGTRVKVSSGVKSSTGVALKSFPTLTTTEAQNLVAEKLQAAKDWVVETMRGGVEPLLDAISKMNVQQLNLLEAALFGRETVTERKSQVSDPRIEVEKIDPKEIAELAKRTGVSKKVAASMLKRQPKTTAHRVYDKDIGGVRTKEAGVSTTKTTQIGLLDLHQTKLAAQYFNRNVREAIAFLKSGRENAIEIGRAINDRRSEHGRDPQAAQGRQDQSSDRRGQADARGSEAGVVAQSGRERPAEDRELGAGEQRRDAEAGGVRQNDEVDLAKQDAWVLKLASTPRKEVLAFIKKLPYEKLQKAHDALDTFFPSNNSNPFWQRNSFDLYTDEMERTVTRAMELIEDRLYDEAPSQDSGAAGGQTFLSKAASGVKAIAFPRHNTVVFNKKLVDNMSEREKFALDLHEIGVHLGLKKMIGAAAYDDIIQRLVELKGKSKMVDEAYASVPPDTEAMHVDEEALAYLVENYHNMSLVRRVVEAIRQWAKKTFGNGVTLEREAYNLAVASMRKHSASVRSKYVNDISLSISDDMERVDFQKMLDRSPVATSILDRLVDALGDNVLLAGSLSISKQRTIYRPKGSSVHDIDFSTTMSEAELRTVVPGILKGAVPLRSFTSNGKTTFSFIVPAEGVQIAKVTLLPKGQYAAYGTKADGVSLLTEADVMVVDFFTDGPGVGGTSVNYTGVDGKTRSVALSGAQNAFAAKMSWLRDKDIKDLVHAGFGDPRFSKQSPTDKAINPKEAIAYLKQAFGQDFEAEVVEQLGGHAGMWTEHGILLAANAPDGTQFHEAVHELFSQLRKHGAANVKALIERAATGPVMKRKLEQLLEAHPKARAQLKSPEEAAAFVFQFWNLGLLEVGSETKGLFETIKGFIAKVAKKLLYLVDAQYREEYNTKEREQADTEAAFEALDMLLNHGKLANKDTRQAIYDALRKEVEAHDKAMANLGRGVDNFYRSWGKLFVSNEAMLGLYKEHPELKEIADKFHQVHGSAMKNQARDGTLDAYGGFMEAVGSLTNKWMTRMERMLDGYDQKDLELALKYLETGKGNSSDPKIAKLVDDVRKYMGEMYDYMVESDVRRLDPTSKERWVPVERRANYWTQVWDVETLLSNRDTFIAKLMQHHMSNLKQMADEANKELAAWKNDNRVKPASPSAQAAVENGELDTITPEMIAESIYSRLINSMGMIDIEENEWSMGITPGAAAVNRRQLDWLDKEAFSEFKSKDMVNIMTTYTRSMIKRGEYQKRFGYGGEVIAKSVDTAWLREMGGQALVDTAEDTLPLAIKAWKLAAAAWHADNPDAPYPEPYPTLRSVGVQSFRSQNGDEKTNEALINAEKALRPAINSIRALEGTLGSEISPAMRNFNSWAVSYQNVRLLPFMLFTNLSDVIGITVQGGTLGDAWNAFVEGIRGIRDSWKGERNKGAMMGRAEEWGVVDAGALLDSLGQAYGSVYMSQSARRFNEKFFRVIGAEGWNRGIRAAAASVGERIILDWAKNGVDMKKAGEKERFERLFGEGADPKRIALSADGSIDTQDHRNRAAISRFVQDSVMTSNAAHRTAWMADPRYATFAHLKNFAYTFHRVMLLGILDQAKKGNLRPAAVAGLGYASIAIAGGALKEMLIPGDEPAWMKGGLNSYLEYGYRQAGLGGVPMMWLDSALDLDPAKAAGPMWDQIQNTITSPIPGFKLNLSPFDGETEILKDRKVLSELARAVPAGNIAGRWMDDALRD